MWPLKGAFDAIKSKITGSNNNNEADAPKETDPEAIKKQEEISKRRKEMVKFTLSNILAAGVRHVTKSHVAGEAVKTALEVGWEATELTVETRKEVNEVKLFLNKQEAEFNDLRFFQLAELCAWLSYHAYEPKDESNSANPVTINEQVSLNFKYKEVLKLMDKHVFWFVAQDKARNIVYVVFRGTSVAGDVVIDLYADLHADDIVKDYMAHKGIYQSVHKELDAVKEAIKNCDVNEKTYFVLTGHSLGGGLATMLYTYMKTKSEYQNNRMIVVTFGAPLVLAPSDNGWPEALQSISKDVHNFVHNADIIPRVLGNENVKLLPMFANLLKKTVGDSGANLLLNGLSMQGGKFEERLGKYRPYGEIYLLYGEDKVLRASSDEEKRKILSLPAILCFEVVTQPKKVFEHHGIGLYLDFLKATVTRERAKLANKD